MLNPMRTVVKAERSWHHFFLTLSCGHFVHREARGGTVNEPAKPPRRARCNVCDPEQKR